MKSVLSFARAALVLGQHRSLLSTTGISQRGLLDHQVYLMQTLQNSVIEAVDLCGIDFQSLSFFDENNTTNLDIDVALVKHYASLFPETCSETDEQNFRTALKTFQTCSSFDIEGILETFGDAVIGSVMDCTTSVAPLLKRISNATELFDIVIPAQCTNSLLGKNPLGDIIRSTILYPDVILPCFTALSKSIPSCTVDEWPVPLVGPIIKKSTCLVGASKDFFARLSQHNLGLLDVCLPEMDGDESADARINCASYCSDLVGTEVLLNYPFSDLGKRVAVTDGLQDVIPRFEAFAAQCLDDPWPGWSYPTNDYYNGANVKLYPEHPGATGRSSSDDVDGNDGSEDDNNDIDGTKSSVASSVDQDNVSDDGEDRFAIGFATGLLTGLFTAGFMWAVVKCCQRMRKREQQDPKNTSFAKEQEDTGSSSDSDSENSDSDDIYQDITHTIS